MRPRYETQGDLDNEMNVEGLLADMWGCEIRKLPVRYTVDWAVIRNDRLKAYAEFKQRRHPSTKYMTFMLSHLKWCEGRKLADEAGVPFLVIVRFEDGLFYHQAKSACEIGWGGRADRGDSQDMETVVYIPCSQFKRIV